jgi:hypothetical protein
MFKECCGSIMCWLQRTEQHNKGVSISRLARIYHLELLLIARQPEEEVLLFSVYAGLAVHRAIMLRVYLVILLVLLTSHTVPTCMKSGTQLTFLNCMTGSSKLTN